MLPRAKILCFLLAAHWWKRELRPLEVLSWKRIRVEWFSTRGLQAAVLGSQQHRCVDPEMSWAAIPWLVGCLLALLRRVARRWMSRSSWRQRDTRTEKLLLFVCCCRYHLASHYTYILLSKEQVDFRFYGWAGEDGVVVSWKCFSRVFGNFFAECSEKKDKKNMGDMLRQQNS